MFSLAAAKSFHLLCYKWPGPYCVTGLKDEDMLTLSQNALVFVDISFDVLSEVQHSTNDQICGAPSDIH